MTCQSILSRVSHLALALILLVSLVVPLAHLHADHENHHSDICLFCLFTAHAAFMEPTVSIGVPIEAPPISLVPDSDSSVYSMHFPPLPQLRAPPLS